MNSLTEHEHVDWHDVHPPHEPNDWWHVDDLTNTLRFSGHLPPLLLWGDRLLTGSHRYETFVRQNMPVCVTRLPDFVTRALRDAGFAPDGHIKFGDVYQVIVDSGFVEWHDHFTENLGLVPHDEWMDLAMARPEAIATP